MDEAVVVGAVRTPIGRRNGMLKDWHPVDLLAFTLQALVERTAIDPTEVDDVIAGCVSQTGEQAANIARNAWLAGGLPISVPGTTVDRQCGSSQQALHFAAQSVISGACDMVVACGIESMTRIPMGVTIENGPGVPFNGQLHSRFDLVSQGTAAELIAERWNLSRRELDEIGLRSHELALQATKEGRFESEIVSTAPRLESDDPATLRTMDEGMRETSLEVMAGLPAAFQVEGRITAGNSSQIADGAAAVLIASRQKAQSLNLTSMASFHSFAVTGDDPVMMLTAPIEATKRVLHRGGLAMADIGVVEINEAFACVVAAWQRELGLPHDEIIDPGAQRVNPNGGAISLGHPLGASGVRLMTTMLHEMERRDLRYGLQTMCEGGGLANALIMERV